MDKRFVLLVVILVILGGIFWTESLILKETELTEPDQPTERDLQTEELPQKGFENLQVTYFGDDQQYRMDTVLKSMEQKLDGDVTFHEMQARLYQGDELIQELVTPEGSMVQQDGIVRLKGPIQLVSKEYQLSTDEMWLNLNQGTFRSKGQVTIQSEKITVEAEEMDADFDLNKIHLTGRPRLTVKKGG